MASLRSGGEVRAAVRGGEGTRQACREECPRPCSVLEGRVELCPQGFWKGHDHERVRELAQTEMIRTVPAVPSLSLPPPTKAPRGKSCLNKMMATMPFL